MRMTPSAWDAPARIEERLFHVATRPACRAVDIDFLELFAVSAMLIVERAVALRFAAVDELAPREVVEMTVGARDDEAHGQRRARGFRVMFGVIDVALLGGVRDVAELEDGVAVEAIEASTFGASEPSGKSLTGTPLEYDVDAGVGVIRRLT